MKPESLEKMIRKSLLLGLVISLFLNISAEGEERLLTDETGRKVKIPHSPKKIVSLAPSITETLFALGLNEEIAAVTDFCDYPAAVLTKPKIGGFVNPDVERIVSLRPDLVIGIRDGNRMDTVHRLNDFGFPVYLIDPRGFDGVMLTVKNVGEIVGRQEEGRRISRNMLLKKKETMALTQSLSKPKVFFQVGDAPVVTVGRETLADDLIRLAGGRSISENESMSYPFYSIETILSRAPEIIIISSMESSKDYSNLVKKWQNWTTIPAVKMNAIYVVDSNLVDRPTPRIEKGLDALVRIIHPEVLTEKNHHQGKNQ
jgi:iron complex transport system substrate-binding protein